MHPDYKVGIHNSFETVESAFPGLPAVEYLQFHISEVPGGLAYARVYEGL